MDLPETYREPLAAARIALIATSHARIVGRPLIDPDGDPIIALWDHRLAIVAHGIESDPLFFFGNRAALERFGYPGHEFVGLPSRLSAEAPLREARRALLDRVSRRGFIDDYAGIRVGKSGARFEIAGATVWNLVDADGRALGQAAAFAP